MLYPSAYLKINVDYVHLMLITVYTAVYMPNC